MNNKRILGISLIALNIVVWLVVAMMVWKSRHVNQYLYDNQK